jgi:hypothetical protein
MDSASEMAPSGCGSDTLPMRGSSNPDASLNSERSISAISSLDPDGAFFQFNTISPQTNKTLTTVATIRTRRDRNTSTNLVVLVDCGGFFVREVLVSDRNLDVVRAGFTGTGSHFGVASESEELVGRGSAAGSTDFKRIASVACVPFGSVGAEIEDNTAAEHHSGSISKFDSDSDTVSSRKTRMSLRVIGVGLGKL